MSAGGDEPQSLSPSPAEKRHGLRWAVVSELFGSAYGVLALGSIFVLFLDELGLRKEQIGLLNGLIFLPGPIALFIAPYLARFGSKRALIFFYGARKFVAASLILAPGVFAAWGQAVTFAYVFAVMALYGLCRVIAETAFYPWIQEFVPNQVRGQFMAVCNIAGTLASMLAAHLAPMDVHFYQGERFPERYRDAAFVAFRGGSGAAVIGHKVVALFADADGQNAQVADLSAFGGPRELVLAAVGDGDFRLRQRLDFGESTGVKNLLVRIAQMVGGERFETRIRRTFEILSGRDLVIIGEACALPCIRAIPALRPISCLDG